MRWEAIVLAGGKLEDHFRSFGPLPSKAYLPIQGRAMAEYVLDALRGVPVLERIICVIPDQAPEFSGTVSSSGGGSIIESMSSGMSVLSPQTDMALVVTCDLPCLSREGVEDFMLQCEAAGAALCYSFVFRTESERRFPGIPHTYIKTREAEVCGGGLIGISPRHFPALRSFAARATASRKNIFKIAGILGIPFLLKLLFKRLSIEEAEARAGELLGFPAKGIPSHFPEIAFNVDDSHAVSLAAGFLES